MGGLPQELDLDWLATDPAASQLLDPDMSHGPRLHPAFESGPPPLPGAARYVTDHLAPLTLEFRAALKIRMASEHGIDLVEGHEPMAAPAAAYRGAKRAPSGGRPSGLTPLYDDDLWNNYERPSSFAPGGIPRGSYVDLYLGPFPHTDPTPMVEQWSHGRGKVGEWALAQQHADRMRQEGSRTALRASLDAANGLRPAAEAEWALAVEHAAAWARQARDAIATAEELDPRAVAADTQITQLRRMFAVNLR